MKGQKYHSKHQPIELLGKILYLSDDRRSGIFDSPTRGIVSYDSLTDTFEEVYLSNPRITGCGIRQNTKVHTVFGDVYFLFKFLEKSGLIHVFRDTFSQNSDYERLLAHVAHGILRDGSHISCEYFISKSFASYLIPHLSLPSLKTDSRFFAMMGDDKTRMTFFRNFVQTMRKKDPDFGRASYVDSTPLPNDIMENPFNALCSHGLSATSIQMRLILILDQKSGLPVWYEIIPGNVLDVSTLMGVVSDVRTSLNIEIIDLVLDAGYVSKDMITAFHVGSEKTITARMPAKKGYPFKALYWDTKNLFHKGKYQFRRGGYTYFGIRRQTEIFDQPVYTYIYVDHYNAQKKFNQFLDDHLEEYDTMKDCDKDFRMVKGGYFVLVSNIETTPSKMLSSYFGRTDIEKVFKTAKEYLELLPLNKWTDDTVRGKILHDIINTTVVLLMRKELEDSGISVPDIAGATQSLMCFRDENGNVTVETPNKKVKEYYKQMDIKIPSHLVVDEFCEKILLL